MFFYLALEKSLHGIFCGHVQRKLPLTVHCPDVSAVLDQVSLTNKNTIRLQSHRGGEHAMTSFPGMNVTVCAATSCKVSVKSVSVVMVSAHLVIWMKPQEAAACRGVQPSLSPLFTSLPLSTRNCTISAFSSMQACRGGGHTHSHMTDCS